MGYGDWFNPTVDTPLNSVRLGHDIIVPLPHELSRSVGAWHCHARFSLKPDGCDWLQDYLATHEEARERLPVCQK